MTSRHIGEESLVLAATWVNKIIYNFKECFNHFRSLRRTILILGAIAVRIDEAE